MRGPGIWNFHNHTRGFFLGKCGNSVSVALNKQREICFMDLLGCAPGNCHFSGRAQTPKKARQEECFCPNYVTLLLSSLKHLHSTPPSYFMEFGEELSYLLLGYHCVPLCSCRAGLRNQMQYERLFCTESHRPRLQCGTFLMCCTARLQTGNGFQNSQTKRDAKWNVHSDYTPAKLYLPMDQHWKWISKKNNCVIWW